MNKLETQINQIYLIRPENKKCSLILYEETLSPDLHLFLILELSGMARKTEAAGLKKISDIILTDFRSGSRMTSDSLFESALAQANQHLADFAHKGSRSWLGKLSAAIVLKSGSSVYLANSGQMSVWLKRKSDLSEVISPEKRGTHPLKIFSNFASGKLAEGDVLAALTTSIFNYVSLPLFGKLLKLDPQEAADEISKILLDSSGADDAFAAFFLEMVPAERALAGAYPIGKASDISGLETEPAIPAVTEEEVYAPLPESLDSRTRRSFRSLFRVFRLASPVKLFRIPSLPRPSVRLPFRIPNFYRNLSFAGKFFLICFLIFLILGAANLGAALVKTRHKKAQAKIDDLVGKIQEHISETETALIYRNEIQAANQLSESRKYLEELVKLDSLKAGELSPKVDELAARVTRTNSVAHPRTVTEVKLSPVFLARAGTGFLFSGSDIKSLSSYDGTFKPMFMLNSVQAEVTGLNHVPGIGNFIVSGSSVYQIDPNLNQLDKKADVQNGNLSGLKYLDPGRVYTFDRTSNQILRMTADKGKLSAPQSALKTASLKDLRDFGMDSDIYVLYKDSVRKFSKGKESAIKLTALADPLSDATRLFVGSNLYVLEPGKNRLLIFSKNGTLLNQILFPTLKGARDIYVNEQQRVINILDSEKLVEITF